MHARPDCWVGGKAKCLWGRVWYGVGGLHPRGAERAAPLAPGTDPPEVGWPPSTTASAATAQERAARADPSPGKEEPALGLSPHPGRAPQARPALLPPDRLSSASLVWPQAGTTAWAA